ncbi:MAG: hypothetical protein ACK55Z_24280, partial [bacterium]
MKEVYGWWYSGCGWSTAYCWLISVRRWLWLVGGLSGFCCPVWFRWLALVGVAISGLDGFIPWVEFLWRLG